MPDDKDYTIGVLETQIKYLSEEVIDVKKDIKAIRLQTDKLDRWEQRAVGAVAIFSAVGAVVIYLGDGLLNLIRTKLGF